VFQLAQPQVLPLIQMITFAKEPRLILSTLAHLLPMRGMEELLLHHNALLVLLVLIVILMLSLLRMVSVLLDISAWLHPHLARLLKIMVALIYLPKIRIHLTTFTS